jgi:hypothetical protein
MESKFKMLTLSILGILSCVGGLGRVEAEGAGDSWELVVADAGVSAMHMTLHHTNRVIMFDRTDYGPSKIKLPGGYCRKDNKDVALKVDCWAHSINFDVASSKIRPLTVQTDTWCSSGAFQADGSLTQTGGWNDGGTSVRKIGFAGGDDWKEYPGSLAEIRWYASNQILPDGRQIVIGGRRQFNYEFVPRRAGEGAHEMPLLAQTSDPGAENNLYPFVHLSTDGNLFIFANQDSIMFNYKTGKEVRRFPRLAGGPRNYPSSGSSVLLPITARDGYKAAEVLICGGAPAGSYQNTGAGKYTPAIQTCGRLVITAANPQWKIENMPSSRVMGDMLILPTGEILIINGAKLGTAGWHSSREPALAPVLYNPGLRRFQEMAATTIPRLYHSTALVLPDGKVLVAGSNPNQGYSFAGVMYATELRIEKYSPPYLYNGYNNRRPQIVLIGNTNPKYGAAFKVTFKVASAPAGVAFHLYAPPFVTHTYSMNQRMLILGSTAPAAAGGQYVSTVTAPPSAVTAPAGYYLLTVINGGIPSTSAWVHIG